MKHEPTNDPEGEFREEAERLRTLPPQIQRQLIAEHQAIAANPKVPKADRELARQRARALKSLLFPRRKKD
jgi:hypothetical protein